MSARYDVAATVLDTAVRYYMPPSDIAKLINNIFNDLGWDNCYPNPYPYAIECFSKGYILSQSFALCLKNPLYN